MFRAVAVAAFLLTLQPSVAQPTPTWKTIDAQYREADNKQPFKVLESTRDACSRTNVVTVTSAVGGACEIRPGETKYFVIHARDEYTRSGGWYWRCGTSEEQSRLRGAAAIKVVRDARGVTDWYSVPRLP